ncbi:MAG: HD-GYP domain-containing protein [Chloroflexi bacterium]|nr:HD-GYP domain-containing protein [Chloroflexota bacterium]
MKPKLRLTFLQKFSLTSLVLTAVIAVSLASIMQRRLDEWNMGHAADAAAVQVQDVVNPFLRLADLTDPLEPSRLQELDAFVKERVLSRRIVRVKIWAPDGRVVFSDEKELVGRRFPVGGELAQALGGRIASDTSSLDRDENEYERSRGHRLGEVYVPLRPSDSTNVAGAYEVYLDLGEHEQHIADSRIFAWLSVIVGFLVLYAIQFAWVRKASNEIIQRSDENERLLGERLALFTELEHSYVQTVLALAEATDARDSYTSDHARGMAAMAVAVGRQLGMDASELDDLYYGAVLHDVGKIGAPDAILLKPGKLDSDEWRQMREHPAIGEKILAPVPRLAGAARLVHHHHERFDGNGYPDGLAGDAIPLGARILAVVDSYGAMTDQRVYKEARSPQEAQAELRRCAGGQFDPRVVDVFMRLLASGIETLGPLDNAARGQESHRRAPGQTG